MESLSKPYGLIHVINFQEFYTPLVLSQVFEQAAIQQTEEGEYQPQLVQVWVLVPMRMVLDRKFKKYNNYLCRRFLNLNIQYFYGIDRLFGFPQKKFLYKARKSLGNLPFIFHFRGDDLLTEIAWIKDKFPNDKFVADIRGIWPAERLLLDNVEILNQDELFKYPISEKLTRKLVDNLKFADGLSTVSSSLLTLVKSLSSFQKRSWVVPCSIKLNPETELQTFKTSDSTFTIGYLGGTAVYQNLEDLVLPLLKEVASLSDKVKFLFITHQPEQMYQMIEKVGLPKNRFQIKSVSQDQVHQELEKMDLGMLVRKQNLVNNVAQPVKIGEYLGAGVPVCIEGSLGGLDLNSEAILRLDIAHSGLTKAATEVLNFITKTDPKTRRKAAIACANERFSWNDNIKIHRRNYINLISNT